MKMQANEVQGLDFDAIEANIKSKWQRSTTASRREARGERQYLHFSAIFKFIPGVGFLRTGGTPYVLGRNQTKRATKGTHRNYAEPRR